MCSFHVQFVHLVLVYLPISLLFPPLPLFPYYFYCSRFLYCVLIYPLPFPPPRPGPPPLPPPTPFFILVQVVYFVLVYPPLVAAAPFLRSRPCIPYIFFPSMVSCVPERVKKARDAEEGRQGRGRKGEWNRETARKRWKKDESQPSQLPLLPPPASPLLLLPSCSYCFAFSSSSFSSSSSSSSSSSCTSKRNKERKEIYILCQTTGSFLCRLITFTFLGIYTTLVCTF